MKNPRWPLFLVKLFNYEYWTWWVFYLPMLPYWVFLSVKTRSFAFFTAANPCMDWGGFFGESKSDILRQIPAEFLPKHLFFKKTETSETVVQAMREAGFDFPVVVKPDVGERGNKVEKVANSDELTRQMATIADDFIIQEFVEEPLEFGILYSRLPGEAGGRVTSVTRKEFLAVTGDGTSTIGTLMDKSTRARFQLDAMHQRLGAAIQDVLPIGKTRLLEPIGNHCRGTKFINDNALINARLNEVFDQIARPIEGFHFGRFDLKVRSVEDLYAGRTIRVMELNGASSEPGHIYDPGFTLARAYRDLARHWAILAEICQRQKRLGVQPVPFSTLLKVTWAHFRS
ncbi:MAG: hypothetical protein LH606_08145 [Cytophagaceae bacterium]|nr:hypothetical protein [Cytophagaceae bacterium]